MASVEVAKSDIRPAGRSIPPTSAHGRTSKIPVRSDTSSGSASDDSDDAAKSSLKAKRYGKSKIPRVIAVRNVAKTKSTETTGNTAALQDKCPQRSGMQRKLSSTAESSGAKPKVGGVKAIKKETAKPKPGLKRRELKESPSFNEARNNTLGSRHDLGIQKKSSKTSKVTSNTGGKAKKGHGLPEEEQDKPKRGTTIKTTVPKHPVLGKVNNGKLPMKKRQNSTSTSKQKITPRERKDNVTPSKLKTDVAIQKEEEEGSDSSLSESSLESDPRSFDYEAESDDLLAGDSDVECVPKETQSQVKQQNDPQEVTDCVQDNEHGLPCVPEEAHGHADESSKEKHSDRSERKVVICEPNELPERRGRPRVRGFSDELKIHINFVYEPESDEFTSSNYSESIKEQSEEKKDMRKVHSPAQSPDKNDRSSHDADENLALTDNEIENIAADIDIEKKLTFQKNDKFRIVDSVSTEVAKSTVNALQDDVKTQVEAGEEDRKMAVEKPPVEVTRDSSVSQLYEGDAKNALSHKSEDSDDSFFGIKAATAHKCNATEQDVKCKGEDMMPKENAIHIERLDLKDNDDGKYLGKNCESLENESYIMNAINDEVRAGFAQESNSVSEGIEDKIQNKDSRKFEDIQYCRMLDKMPNENGKSKTKKASVDEDTFGTNLEKPLSAANADIEEGDRKCQTMNTSQIPQKNTSLLEEGYIPYKPPIVPKQHPKQRTLKQENGQEVVLKFDRDSERESEKTKDCLSNDTHSSTTKPEQKVEDVCSPSNNNPKVLMCRNVKETCHGIRKASNESSKKGETSSISGASGRESTQATGPRENSVTMCSMSSSGSHTAGGSGDDDPNDPTRRPQRQEPDDKRDKDTEDQRRKGANKALVIRLMGIADDLLQDEYQSLNKTLFTRRPSRELEVTLESTSDCDLTLPSKEDTSVDVSCDEEQSLTFCTGEGKEFEGEGASIKALASENNLLKTEVTKLKTEINQMTKEVRQALEKNRTYKSVISKMEVDLEALELENIELTQECKALTNEEVLKELRKVHAEISEASKEIASEDGIERGPTSSPLSVELAEVDGFSLQQQPEVDETSEIVTLMHSIAAMTEEFRDQIARNKTKLAKTYFTGSLIEVDDIDHDSEEIRELQKEIGDLQEQVKEERTKFKTFESICKNRIEENKKIREQIKDLELELAKSEDRLKETVTHKNRELINIRNNMESKGNKVDRLMHELELLSDQNGTLKSQIDSLNSSIRVKESRETELESIVDELTTANEQLFEEVSEERSNTQKYQRENDEQISTHSMDVARLEPALQDKIDELVEVLSSIDSYYVGNQPLPDHPCMESIENGIRILYDVSGLLKAIGSSDLQSGEVREAIKETKVRELEIMIEDLSEEVETLTADKERLVTKWKFMNGDCREDTSNEHCEMEDEMMLRQQLDERETQLSELEQQMTTLQSENASLSKILGNVKELAAKDAEVHLLQLDGHLSRIEALQEENDKQKVQIKTLDESLLDCKDKNQALKTEIEDLELGKEALQYKVERKVKEVIEHMTKHESLRMTLQEVSAEKQNFQEKLEIRDKELSELKMKIEALSNKLKAMDEEKEAIEQKLKQEVDNKLVDAKSVCTGEVNGQPTCNCTVAVSSGKTNDLQAENEELKEKLELYDAFLSQVKTEKADYSKALEESRQNVMMLRKSSDEQIAKLRKDLEGKGLSETEFQGTIKLLKERIAALEEEKAESLKQIKAIVEGIQGENELVECKREWNELELELKNSVSAPRSENTDTQKELLTKVRKSFQVRMKELDECLKDRHALREELASLKDLHLEQKKELECMNERITEKETEVKIIRKSSSEMINDLEKQLKGREDSAMELQEKATLLSKKVAQFETEKFENDKKIKALMESLKASEDMSNLLKERKNIEERKESDMILVMKNSQEKIVTLEKELQDRSESEIVLHNSVCSLELRISELHEEKNERENKLKTLLEALNAKKNLEEHVQRKDEVEKQLLQKLEKMQTEFAKLKSTKEVLERRLISQPIPPVPAEKSKNLKDDSGVEESAKREKELTNQIQNLSDQNLKTEKLLREKESQVLLATKTSEAKIEDLENRLRSKTLSEEELQERMRSLEHKIFLLEGEKVRHSKSISSMLRSLKARDELSVVIKARDGAEKEYNVKLDEMEVIVNKLRNEKSKHDCDIELKKKYKDEYEESRNNVRKITEEINEYNARVEHLQAIVDGHEEQDDDKEEFDEVDLSENIEDLRNSLGTSDDELLQTQQALQDKINSLEVEKAEFESVMTALLNSMEAKEKIEYSIEATREADKKIVQQMDEMLDAVQRLKSEKEKLEQEFYDSENIRAAITMDAELLQTQSNEKLSFMEQSLKESFESEKDLKTRLELMTAELTRLEGEKLQADQTVQTMLASLQGREQLEECLRDKERVETMLESRNKRNVNVDRQEANSVASLIELLQSKEQQLEQCQKEKEESEKILKAKEIELELREKDDERHSRDFEECLKEKNENLKILVREIEWLKANLTMVEEEKNSLLQKLEQHSKMSEEREEEVNKIIQREQNLLQRLSYAENILQQLKDDKHDLKKQLKQERQERQDASNIYMDKIRFISDAIEQKHADTETELRHMISQLNNQIAVIQNEEEAAIEKHRKTAENLNMELLFQSKREEKLKEQINELEDEITRMKTELSKQVKLQEETGMETEKLQKERNVLSKREEKLREQMDDLEDEVTRMKTELRKQVNLQQEKDMEIENLHCERKLLSENVTKMESKWMKEVENKSKREAELREEKDVEIKKLKSENDGIVEDLKTKILKLEMELEFREKNEAKLRKEEEKVVEELKLQEVEQLKSTIKTLEEEGRILKEEREDLQSEATRRTDTLRDKIDRLQGDLEDELDHSKTLQEQLNEMKSKASSFSEEKQNHEKEISVYEDRITKHKCYLKKFQRQLKKQKEHEQCMKDNLTSQVNDLQIEITRLTEVERVHEEGKAEYDSSVRRLKLYIEDLEAQINDEHNDLLESRAKVSALEEMKVQSDAEHDRQQQEVVSECKRANAKIDELREELRLNLKSTSALENEMKTLKGKTAEINRKTESQKTEIAKLNGLSKGLLTKDEEQIEKLKKGSEELRGHVFCLQEEKKALAGTVDGFQLFVARHKIEMERLENMIKEQEEKTYNCQNQSSENTQGIEALRSSIDNSERLRNTWHFYDDFKKWYNNTQCIQSPYSRIGRYSSTTSRFY